MRIIAALTKSTASFVQVFFGMPQHACEDKLCLIARKLNTFSHFFRSVFPQLSETARM